MDDAQSSAGDASAQSATARNVALTPYGKISIRPARQSEIDLMLALFEDEVRAGRMLGRDPANVANYIGDWLVAEDSGEVVGCVSLVFFNEELCEVRSLAVHPERRGNGLGNDLILAALDLARERGMRRVLTLTRALSAFERVGFRRDLVANYPEKVWRDCTPCPFRVRCDEVALIYVVEPDDKGGHDKDGNGHDSRSGVELDFRSR